MKNLIEDDISDAAQKKSDKAKIDALDFFMVKLFHFCEEEVQKGSIDIDWLPLALALSAADVVASVLASRSVPKEKVIALHVNFAEDIKDRIGISYDKMQARQKSGWT